MSSGIYALIGVVVGGGVTAAVQIGVGVFMARRAEKAQWKVANRLVSEEIERLLLDLRNIIEFGVTPAFPIDDRFLSTALWEEHREVIARALPDSDAGDDFWRGLARLTSTTSHRLRPMLGSVPPGTPIDPSVIDVLQSGYGHALRAYEALTGQPPIARPLEAPRSQDPPE